MQYVINIKVFHFNISLLKKPSLFLVRSKRPFGVPFDASPKISRNRGRVSYPYKAP